MVKLKDGELEFRRDTLLVCVLMTFLFFVVGHVAVSRIVGGLNATLRNQQSQLDSLSQIVRQGRSEEERDVEMLKKIRDLEVESRVVSDKVEENSGEIRKLKNLVAKNSLK